MLTLCHVIMNTHRKTLVTDGSKWVNGVFGGIFTLYIFLGVLSEPVIYRPYISFTECVNFISRAIYTLYIEHCASLSYPWGNLFRSVLSLGKQVDQICYVLALPRCCP